MAAYGKKASEKVGRALHEMKQGTLRASSGDKVSSREQAIAIGLSEARAAGGKVPEAPDADGPHRSTSKRSSTASKSTSKSASKATSKSTSQATSKSGSRSSSSSSRSRASQAH